MREAGPSSSLSVLLGVLRQETRNGELVLEQNDGVRKLYLRKGELVHLNSEVAGERFGSYLLRQGILDFPALKLLLAEAGDQRIGARVMRGGRMSEADRDGLLQNHQEQILINALEHPILNWTWNPDGPVDPLSQDLHFDLQHRQFIWRTFQESNALSDLVTILEAETSWRWEGRWDLLDALSDLPLTPGTAYALSFLTADPISFETFRSLSNLSGEEAGRFIGTLWALGALVLTSGTLPAMPLPPAPAGPGVPMAPAGPEPEPAPEPYPTWRAEPEQLDAAQLALNAQPEFLDLDPESEAGREAGTLMDELGYLESGGRPVELSPAGPRLRPADLSPAGPRPPQADLSPAGSRLPPPDPAPAAPRAQPPEPNPARRYDFIELNPAPAREPEPNPPADLPQGGPRLQPSPTFDELPELPDLDRLNQLEPAPMDSLGVHARGRKLLAQARHQVLLNHTVEAVRTLEQAVRLELEGDSAFEAWLLLGRLRSVNPAWSTRAILALQNAARLRPRHAEPWSLMAEIYHRKGFQADAATCFMKALKLDPSLPVPADLVLHDTSRQAPAKEPAKGLLGTFRSLLGRKG